MDTNEYRMKMAEAVINKQRNCISLGMQLFPMGLDEAKLRPLLMFAAVAISAPEADLEKEISKGIKPEDLVESMYLQAMNRELRELGLDLSKLELSKPVDGDDCDCPLCKARRAMEELESKTPVTQAPAPNAGATGEPVDIVKAFEELHSILDNAEAKKAKKKGK